MFFKFITLFTDLVNLRIRLWDFLVAFGSWDFYLRSKVKFFKPGNGGLKVIRANSPVHFPTLSLPLVMSRFPPEEIKEREWLFPFSIESPKWSVKHY